jgi:hypothetical protein
LLNRGGETCPQVQILYLPRYRPNWRCCHPRVEGGKHGRAAIGAVHRLENGWWVKPLDEFESLPFRSGRTVPKVV